MDAQLKLLADKLGISTFFSDAGIVKRCYDVPEDIVRFFCGELGYKAGSEAEIAHSLQALEERVWKVPFENIIVMRQSNPEFLLSLPAQVEWQDISLTLSGVDDGQNVQTDYVCRLTGAEKQIGSRLFRQWQIYWPESLPLGYYRLALKAGKTVYRTMLACVPEKCYTTSAVESGKMWGFSLQLYSVRSRRNWGVGDFTDLAEFAAVCARQGADVIGLNPLNVLFHDFPENASPYNAISRLFLNPIYIDVEKVPGFRWELFSDLRQQVKVAREGELIDYTTIYRLKIKVLHEIFSKHKMSATYAAEFKSFVDEKGWDLELLATYQALYQIQCKSIWGGCCAWPAEMQNPLSKAVEDFRKKHSEEIDFFKFLQFEADRQLKAVYAQIKQSGLKIGLYRDLPVGVCKDSAEFWSDRGAFVARAGAGAPPDAFFPGGQRWCLGAFHPFALKQRAYEPFLKVLRANMAYAGALRIDHVMGLMRLFMIPDHKDFGTYMAYHFDDMIGLLALESHLHQCAVVGESIGNVPDGFMDKLRQTQIYGISVLWAERWQGGLGDFKTPGDYPEDVFVSVGTHDMPPLKMWWFGYDIELKHRLKMIDDNGRTEAYKQRESDRWKLLNALDYNQVWPTDKPRQGDYLYGEGYPEGIEEAVHKLIAASASKVVMLQPEDIFGVDQQQNLPGTDRDKYPNWRRRLPTDLEDYEQSEAFCRSIAVVKCERNK